MMMKNLRVYFCRHGESSENVKKHLAKTVNNARLTPTGIKQTEKLVSFFKKKGVDKVYYSPKKRTSFIAEILDEKTNILHEMVSDLQERNWGELGKHSWTKVSEKLSRFSIEERYSFIPNGGESWKQFEGRLLHAFNEIIIEAKQKKYSSIAIMTHKGCLRALLPVLTKKNIKHHESFDVDLGSITLFYPEKNKIEKFNYAL